MHEISQLEFGDMDACEKALVAAIRRVADRSPLVGADCMSILVRNEAKGAIRIRYLPRFEYRHRLPTSLGDIFVPAAFSPWLVHPGFTQQPSVNIGGGWSEFCGVSVEIESPPVPRSPIALGIFHQRRPPDTFAPRPKDDSPPPPIPPLDLFASSPDAQSIALT
jgi:hypothetical protein